MTATTQLYVPVITSPVAAQLAAAGVAQWLGVLGKQLTGDLVKIRIANAGSSILVVADAVLSPAQVQPRHYQDPLFRWIRTLKNGAAPDGLQYIDYEAERQHNANYYEEIRRLQQGGIALRSLQAEQQNELASRAPRSYWPVVMMVNQMSALTTYNGAAQRWQECQAVYPELVNLIWTLFDGRPDSLERAEVMWAQLAKQHTLDKSLTLPATQIVNPEQGKGANRAKADKLTIGGQDSFWLLEYFKFAGLHAAALPRTVQSKKDRKTYVVTPSTEGIEQRWHEGIFSQFQKEFWPSSAIKMDILAALRYTTIMLEQWQGAHFGGGRQRKPSDFIEGFAVVSYKDLGSAFAVMNVATVGLPNWVHFPENASEAQQLIESIGIHQRLISLLDEKKGEEEQLLRDYRDFLSSHDSTLAAFFRFTTGYASHTMRRMSRRQPIVRLSTADLEAIIYAQEVQRIMKLKPLVENSGFRNIATAIRLSTVTQQFYRSKGDTTYDIRYGLADELHRHSRNNADFMRALGGFVKDYSQENARVMERMAKQGRKEYPRRPLVSTDDLLQLTELVDTYGATTVASMLTAFGYAYDAKAKDDDGPLPSNDPSETESIPSTENE